MNTSSLLSLLPHRGPAWLASAVLLAGLAGGCGRSDVAEVTGLVTYQGEPVPYAWVTFLPDQKGFRPGMSRTDGEGYFDLTTFDLYDGAAVGSCTVLITTLGPRVASKDGKDPDEDPEFPIRDLPPPKKSLIPLRYADQETTDLRVVVEPRKRNFFHFDLQD